MNKLPLDALFQQLALCIIASALVTGCSGIAPKGDNGNNVPKIIQQGWNDSYWNVDAGQQVLNIRSAEYAGMVEASLYLAVADALAKLELRNAAKLIAQQNHWAIKSRREAKADADEFDGGTMGPMQYSVTLGGLAEIRLAQLEKQLESLKGKKINTNEFQISKPLPKLNWIPIILFLTVDEDFWADEMTKRDKYRTWHHWAEFQDMKLQVAYAFLRLNLSPIEWQPLVNAGQMWTDEKARLTASSENADAKDRELGRAAANHFAQLEKQFAPLRAAAHPEGE